MTSVSGVPSRTVRLVDASGSIEGSFATIASAIASAEGGDSILIHPGLYCEETLVIDKPLEICGDCAGDLSKVSNGGSRHTAGHGWRRRAHVLAGLVSLLVFVLCVC